MEGEKFGVNPEDFGTPSWGAKNSRLDVNEAGRGHAIPAPLLGWPNFAHLFGGNIGAHLTHDIFNSEPFRSLGPKTAYERQPGRDPVSIALVEAGALRADPRESRALNGSGQLEYLLLIPHSEVFRFPGRQVWDRKSINFQWGIRLGANAIGK